jgi:hypothetical protein
MVHGVSNPLLEEFLKHSGGVELLDWWGRKITIETKIEAMGARNALCQEYSWAIPNRKAIKTIVSYSPIVEVGAGRGYWAKLIAEAGGDILPFDLKPPTRPDRNDWHSQAGTFMPVKPSGPSVAARYPDHTLMLCWPPYSKEMAFHAIELYRGKHIIYIGEGNGGCTGDDQFHSTLEQEFEEVAFVEIPQWPGMHDSLRVYERK